MWLNHKLLTGITAGYYSHDIYSINSRHRLVKKKNIMAKKKILLDRAEGVKWSVHKEHFCIIVPASAEDFKQKVETIKAMDGKWWDDKNKRWYVPPAQYLRVYTYVRAYGVRCTQEAANRMSELHLKAQKEAATDAAD